jgi:hypothetical protein
MFPAYGSPCKAYRSKLEALPWMCCIQVRFFIAVWIVGYAFHYKQATSRLKFEWQLYYLLKLVKYLDLTCRLSIYLLRGWFFSSRVFSTKCVQNINSFWRSTAHTDQRCSMIITSRENSSLPEGLKFLLRYEVT